MDQKLIEEVKRIELDIVKEFDRICRENNITYYLCGGSLLGAVRHKGYIPWDDDIDLFMERNEYERFCQIADRELPEDLHLQNYHTEPNCGLVFAKIRKKGTTMSETYSHHINMEQGIWIDIFPLDHLPDDVKKADSLKKKVLILKNLYIVKCGYKNPHPESLTYRIAYAVCKAVVAPFSLQYFIHQLERCMKTSQHERTEYLFPFGGAYPKKDTVPAVWFDETEQFDFEDTKLTGIRAYDAYLTQIYGNYMELPPVEKRVGGMHNLYKVRLNNERSPK